MNEDCLYKYFNISLCCKKCGEEFTDFDEAEVHAENCETS